VRTRFAIIILALFLQCVCFAQTGEFRFATYNMQDGLSQSMVKKIVQDKRGFLWFGTQDGLNRFDGKTLRVYPKGLPPKGLPWGNIEDMINDSAGNFLWIATSERGLCILDYETEDISTVPLKSKTPLISLEINALQQTADYIWVATDKGLSIVNKRKKEVVKNIATDQKIKSIIVTPSVVVLLSLKGHAFLINPTSLKGEGSRTVSQLFHNKTEIEIENAFFKNNTIWACTRQGVYSSPIVDSFLKKGLQKHLIITKQGRDLSNNVSYCALNDNKNCLWIGIDSVGLLYKKPGEDRFDLYAHSAINRYSVADNYFWQIFQDKGGVIWVGTDNGVSRRIMPPSGILGIGEEQDLTSNRLYRVFSICPVNDSLLLYGRRGDINVYHLKSGQIEGVENNTGQELRRMYTIYPYREKEFLVGHSSGLFLIKQEGSKFSLLHFEKSELKKIKGQTINTIQRIDEDNFLFGGLYGAGLFKWNEKEKKLTHYQHRDKDKASLVNDNVTKICKVSNGCWIGTEGGLSFFNTDNETFSNYLYPTADSAGKFVYDILPEGDHLWLALYHEGLGKWFPQKGLLQIYDRNQGLANASMYALGKDNSGQLWCSTNGGLSVLSKEAFINYSVADGLPGNEFNSFSVASTPTKLFFGGINGITVIDKRWTELRLSSPSIAISGIRYIAGNAFVRYERTGAIELQHFQNNIELSYAALDYSTAERTEYAYYLEGYDRSWIYNGKSNNVVYTNLDPGSYIFKVKATNPEFNSPANITYLPIEIIPAWYQTLLFKIALAINVGAFVFLSIRWYYRSRLNKQRIEYEKLLAVQEERHRISSEIHDDIGAGLSGIRLLTEMTGEKIKDRDLQGEVAKIHSSVSELSGKMREVIWSLNTENDSLENLIFYLQRQAYDFFEHSAIRVKVLLPDAQIGHSMLNGEKRRHIYLATKEAMHNCLKHSGASLCIVEIDILDNKLSIVVKDNGKGMPRDMGRCGNGLQNMQRRMEEVGGTVNIKKEEGTIVVFSIPVNSNI